MVTSRSAAAAEMLPSYHPSRSAALAAGRAWAQSTGPTAAGPQLDWWAQSTAPRRRAAATTEGGDADEGEDEDRPRVREADDEDDAPSLTTSHATSGREATFPSYHPTTGPSSEATPSAMQRLLQPLLPPLQPPPSRSPGPRVAAAAEADSAQRRPSLRNVREGHPFA